jgi:N-acetylglutamate synthase/N-acetylornithine aminotransferase
MQTEEITKRKVFQGDCLKYKLGETNKDKFRKSLKNKPDKVRELILVAVQKGARKFTEGKITGAQWQEDCEDIAEEIINAIPKMDKEE